MDEIDKRIIEILQNNARTSLKHIAEKTYLSSPAVSARIQKLEREQIITGYYAKVDTEKLGFDMEAYIHLGIGEKDRESFLRQIRPDPRIQECRMVTGEYPVLLKAVFENRAELKKFARHISKYGKTAVQVVLPGKAGALAGQEKTGA